MTDHSANRVPLERLLEHSRWVRALAHSLVRNEDLADDIVQQTWVAAMRAPPSDESRVRPWFRAVVRNFAREAYRTGKTRAAREQRGARPEATPSAAWLYEQADRHRMISEAVTALPETYGTVVLLRFYEGLPPREIAERLAMPVETVRTRLKRGLELLRARLEERTGKKGDAWVAWFAPLLAECSDPTASLSATPERRPVGRAVLQAAGVAALLAAGLWIAGAFERTPGAQDAAVAATRGGAAQPAPANGRERTDDSAATRRSAALSGDLGDNAAGPATGSVAPSPPGVPTQPKLPLAIRFADAAGTGRVPVRVTPIFADGRLTKAVAVDGVAVDGELVIDAGAWSVPGNPVVSVDVLADHPLRVPLASRVPVQTEDGVLRCAASPRFFRAAVVTGKATGAGATPLTAAGFRLDGSRAVLVDSMTCAEDGRFRLRIWPGEPHIVVAVAEDFAPASCRVTPQDDTTDVGALAVERGLSIQGRVRTEDGSPVPGSATLRVMAHSGQQMTLQHPSFQLAVFDGEVRGDVRRLTIGTDGTWAIGGLHASRQRVYLVGLGLAGDLMASGTRVVTPPADGIEMTVTGTTVHVHAPPGIDEGLVQVMSVAGGMGTAIPLVKGRATLRGMPGAKYELALRTRTGETYVATAEPSADDPDRVVELRSATAASPSSVLEIRLPPGVAVTTIALTFDIPEPRDAAASVFRLHVDAPIRDGVAAVTVPLVGRYRVAARPGTTIGMRLDLFVEETSVFEFSPETTARWDLTAQRGGRVRILVHDGRGLPRAPLCRVLRADQPVALEFFSRTSEIAAPSGRSLSPSGVTEVAQAVPAGEYKLELTGAAGRKMIVPFTVVVGRETIVDAVVESN